MNDMGNEPIGFGRLLVTTLLIAAVFVIWALFFTPQNPPEQTLPIESHPIEKQDVTKTPQPQKEILTEEKGEVEIYSQQEEKCTLQNDVLKIEFSNKGGLMTHAFLSAYKQKGAGDDDLVSPLAEKINAYPFMIFTGDSKFDDELNKKLFHMEQSGRNVIFSWSDGKGNSAFKKFQLDEKGFLLSYEVKVKKNGTLLKSVFVSFGPGLGKLDEAQAKNKYFQQEYVGYEEGNSFKKALRAKTIKSPYTEDNYGIGVDLNFVGIANNYFTAIFLKEDTIKSIKVWTFPISDELKKIHPADSDIYLLVETEGRGKIYLGAKDYKELKKLGGLAFRMMNWGWGWFSAICYFLLIILKKLYIFSGNYGIAIFLLTLIVKLLFYPLSQSSMVKMKEMGDAMKVLKPQIDKIRAKYKKQGLDMQSRAKMNEEIMALYQKEGINPLGGMSGCLPLLLQLPILWALFTMLPNTIDLRGAYFALWIKDLSLPDPLYILPILMGISMVISTMMSSTQSVEPSQKFLLYFMPIIFTWFCLWAPAGLTLYWLINNLLTMGQQAIINKQVKKRMLLKQKEKKSTPKGPSRPSHG